MSNCDLCNAAIDSSAKRYSPSQFRAAVRSGLRPPPEVHALSLAMGLSSAQANDGWVELALSSPTDWALCPACARRTDQLLSPPQPAMLPAMGNRAPQLAADPALPQVSGSGDAGAVQSSSAAPNSTVERPGCVTVYALLLAIAGMAVVALATLSFGDVDSAALSLVTLALGVLSVAIAIGLWRMKNWARLVLITLQGLGIVGTLITSCRMMMEYDDPSSLIIALVQVVVSGSIIWWFAENDQLFG